MERLLELLRAGGVAAHIAQGEDAPGGETAVRLEDGRTLVLDEGGDLPCAFSILAAHIARQRRDQRQDDEDAMRRILLGQYDEHDPTLRVEDDFETERCVIVFQSREDLGPLERALAELFPAEGEDAALGMGNGRIAVIRQMHENSLEDLIDLSLAILDTVRSESSMRIAVGIGDTKRGIRSIAQSYEEAIAAMQTGTRFHPARTVHVHRELVVERFLQEVPARTLMAYHGQLFGPHNDRLLSDEMRLTIDKLFECSLNLSEAARRLYIHRNTLVYRLDKLQRAIGLDLRRFDDAVVYKLLYMMGSVADSVNATETGGR